MSENKSFSTAVPAVRITDSGLNVPDEADILSGRLSDFSGALGGAMSTSLSSPQGQLASSESAIIADKNDQLLYIVNQVNPDFSSGRFQDAIGKIYFLERRGATGTTVTATCTGLVGTLIPAGSMAQDEAGYKYVSLSDATIGASGQVDVVFLNLSTGPVGCPAGTLNKIYKAIPGWSGVTNASAGVPGSDEETRADFENRRRNSVARNARNILEAIRGEILSTVENVVDVYVTHNPKKTQQKAGVSQYPLTPGSFYVGVYGGSPADIAAAIWRKDPPYPEYAITWQTLKPVSLHVSVTLKKSDYLPSDITQQVQQSVLSAFNGTDGGLRARVASVVSAGRYYAGVYKTDPENIDILGLTVSRDSLSWTTAVTFGIDEIPVLDVSNIGVKLQEA
ncbi:TPA: baseplate J/gp47 family protein [Salmonella enterica]|nr:baseplate J/gp47 family protein [Salmonella enterica]